MSKSNFNSLAQKCGPAVHIAHAALICGSTGSGKSQFVLDLLELPQSKGGYCGFFTYIIIICPTLDFNDTYKRRDWLFSGDNIFLVDPKDFNGLNDTLAVFYDVYGKMDKNHVLFIIDDCSALNDIIKKRKMLSELAFSGRHVNCSMWILSQKYNAILTDVREQLKWTALFYCKDRDSFNETLEENYVISSREERQEFRKLLAKYKHSKLILVTEQPTDYFFIK